MPPRFFYFDLGKVLVQFDIDQMLRQIAAVSGVPPDRLRAVFFNDGLMRQYETGRQTSREFYEAFCKAIGARPDFDALAWAASDIFTVNSPVLPLAAHLREAGYPMGVLSNTCELHWKYCVDHFRIVAEDFHPHVLSCRVHAMKPDAAIFQTAADLAGFRPEEIFFVDDLAENVAGARAAGFDAVQFTSAAQLANDLRQRGVRFNY
jgi:glucose-1-phosphatase